MTDLTEQWKKGELPLGWYYVKYKSKKIEPAEYMSWYNNDGWCFNAFECDEEDVDEIVERVPDSYEWDMTNKDLRNKCKLIFQNYQTISILKNKLMQCKPELEEWVNKVTKEIDK